MPRIRTIKPEFWSDEKLAPLDPVDRLAFLGLISMADDFGRVHDNVKVIDAFVFPECSRTVRESLANLSRLGRIHRGKASSGKRIIEIVNWREHQRVDKPQRATALPEIEEFSEESLEETCIREPFANHSRTARDLTRDQGSGTRDQGPGIKSNAANKSPRPNVYPEAFEAFWKTYPPNGSGRKRGKRKCLTLWRQVPEAERPRVEEAAQRYRAECDPEYVRDPERFLKADFWRDYLGPAELPAGRSPAKNAGPRKRNALEALREADRASGAI